jgi:hypothetical protein
MRKVLLGSSSLIWIALAAFEAAHDLSGRTWGVLPRAYDLVGILYVPLWIFSAVGVWRRTGYRTILLLAATLAPVIHGLVIRMVGVPEGLLFFLSGPVLAALLMNADRLEKRSPAFSPGAALHA